MNAKGRIAVERIESRVLSGNPLGDPATRELFVYLPPSYERERQRRFAVVYCLTGFTGRGQMLLNSQPFTPNLAERMDNLIARGHVGEMIVVMPDCFTRLGGSQYINSTATGRYEDHLVEEIVPFVDARFRTHPRREGRAVMGKSSGGYGALVHAMRHADVFSAAASHSGDCYFEYCYLPDFPKTVRALRGDARAFLEKFWREERKGKDDIAALNILAMSACYSPDPAAPLGFRLPFDTATGKIHPATWARWLEHDPVRMVARYSEQLKSLKLLYLDAGKRDEFALDLGARALCARLEEMGIAFIHEEFDDGHFNISYRYDHSLAHISKAVTSDK
ncbi:MAG TPA: alpha/beta hydrolase-fold protein [Pyrinomonadaceae bacterium]|nr:alpha/beta hydrolase-fold protein [Pyrinomonadaceae bacterium]